MGSVDLDTLTMLGKIALIVVKALVEIFTIAA